MDLIIYNFSKKQHNYSVNLLIYTSRTIQAPLHTWKSLQSSKSYFSLKENNESFTIKWHITLTIYTLYKICCTLYKTLHKLCFLSNQLTALPSLAESCKLTFKPLACKGVTVLKGLLAQRKRKRNMHRIRKNDAERYRKKTSTGSLFLSAFLEFLRVKKHLELKLLMLLPNIHFTSTQFPVPSASLCFWWHAKRELQQRQLWEKSVSTEGFCFLKLSTEQKNKRKRLKTSNVYFYFLFLPLNQTTIYSWGRSFLCKAQESQAFCENALSWTNESKDDSFQGSVNYSYFSLRKLTREKKYL